MNANNKFVWRCDVWKDTQERAIKEYSHRFPPKSKKYKWSTDIISELSKGKRNFGYNTVTLVVDSDTIDAAIYLKTEKQYNPALLNMADPYMAGGCVDIGSGAQEENIFRRSNYFLTLNAKNENRGVLYPMKPDELIYSPSVLVFKGNESNGYPLMETPVELSMIACAAISKPIHDYKRQRLYTKEYEITKKKIQLIFETAYQNGHDSLVLSALGCGAFANPPDHISKIFKEVIEEYYGCFKVVVFAIINNLAVKNNDMYIMKNRPEVDYSLDGPPRDNYSVFKRTFG